MADDVELLGEFWENQPYGVYLNAVDDLLESTVGRNSTQAELAYIAECQEACCLPSECANSIHFDNWVVHGDISDCEKQQKVKKKLA